MFLIIVLMACSVWQFVFSQQTESENRLSIAYEVFYTLIIIYTTVIMGFGLLYFAFSFYDVILIDNNRHDVQSVIELWWKSLYFSGVTMLTIGYGDISPLGIGRALALIQALIGFILPTAFVLKIVHLNYEAKKQG